MPHPCLLRQSGIDHLNSAGHRDAAMIRGGFDSVPDKPLHNGLKNEGRDQELSIGFKVELQVNVTFSLPDFFTNRA